MLQFTQSKMGVAVLMVVLLFGLVSHAAAYGPSSRPQQATFKPNIAHRASFASASPERYPDFSRPYDGGGNVLDYFSNARAADSGFGHTVIAGVCASACTMKLGMRNACIEPDATLLFHQARASGYRSELATRIMLDAYPRGIRSWAMRSRALDSDALTELTGRQAIALGVRSCRA